MGSIKWGPARKVAAISKCRGMGAQDHNNTYLLGVPESIVVGQSHELVDQVRLIQVAGQGTQLLVGRQFSSGDTRPLSIT